MAIAVHLDSIYPYKAHPASVNTLAEHSCKNVSIHLEKQHHTLETKASALWNGDPHL